MTTHQANSSVVPAQLSPSEQGYVPTEEWPDVTAMLAGFGDPSLPASEKLEGTTFVVVFEGGRKIEHKFAAGEVTWRILEGEASGSEGTHPYRTVELRSGIFFVDFLKGKSVGARDVSLVINVNNGSVTVAESSFVDRGGQVRMRTDVAHGVLEGFGEVKPLAATSELVGKRIYYRYSPTEHYEHIYLNVGTFVWHCVRGAEVGLADADPVQVWHIADDLVLLHWSETVMPVESIVTIDLAAERSVGRMFCWDGPTLDKVHIPFDSQFTVLADTDYPAE